MTDGIVRIKSPRPGYRRGGQEFGSDWTEVDTNTLSRDQQRAILADGVLTIEGREADGSWTPLTDQVRGGLLSLVGVAVAVEGVETPFEVDPGLLAKANDWDALLAQVSLHRADLEGLKLWPVPDVSNLLVALIQGLREAEAVIADRDQSILTLKADRDEDEKAHAKLNAEYEAMKASMAAPHNPSDVHPGGGASDGAGPAGGEQSRQEGPETAGNTSPAGGTDKPPANPAPKPKPATKPKPPAQGEADNSKSA